MIFFLLRALTCVEQAEPAMFTEVPSPGVAAFMGFARESGLRALKRPLFTPSLCSFNPGDGKDRSLIDSGVGPFCRPVDAQST